MSETRPDPGARPVSPRVSGPSGHGEQVVLPDALSAVDPAAQAEPAPGLDRRGHVRRTRTGGIWIGLILTAVFLVLLIVFIAQNTHEASVHLFGWNGQFPLGLTILFAAIVGVLLVAIPGSVRIIQLRRNLRKNAPTRRSQ